MAVVSMTASSPGQTTKRERCWHQCVTETPWGMGPRIFKYRFQWNFSHFFFAPRPQSALYRLQPFAQNHQRGAEELSPPTFTRNDASKLKSSGGPVTQDNTSVEYHCTIFAAAESPKTPGLLWTGSERLGVCFATAAKDWTNATPRACPSG